MSSDLRRSVLHDRHIAAGAKCAPFGGWEMPLEYIGVLREHEAVRSSAGVFDVSHLGRLRVEGDGAAFYLNNCLTNDLDRIGAGQAQYTLCCSDNGGVIDDLIVYRETDDSLLLVPNAANVDEVARLLFSDAPLGIVVVPEDRAILAVQGPSSAEILTRIGLPSDHEYMSFVDTDGVIVCRTGYTGEHGYELIAPLAAAPALWDAIVAAGVQPCGLGARDTLRTEMGYPLHGQDLSREITPIQARLRWAVGFDKPRFWGREALRAEREAGPTRTLWGLRLTDRGVPRPGMPVRVGDERVGVTTSGTFSPTLRTGIALALLDISAGLSPDDKVALDIRGRSVAAVVTRPPFVTSRP